MATYNYKGTGITGTSTTAKIFKKSGVTKAAVNQYYFNTETGHVYKCTVAGAASTAKWQYVRTDISNSPDKEVTGLGAPSRGDGNHVMTASWKVPNNLTNAKNGRRATDLEIDWALGIAGKDPKVVKKTANESLTTHSINLNNLKIGSKTYTRASFYPYSNKPTLKYVTVKVKARNSRGSSAGVKATRNFTAPRKPSISAFSFNNETGNVSATITTNAGADYQERHDTKYKVEIYNSVTGKTTTPTDTSSTSTSVSVSGGYSGYQGLTDDQYVKVTVSAFARGYAGDSESVSKSCYISAPTKASIGELSQKSDRCAVNISMPKKKAHPITGVRLQYLANTTYAKASDIPASPGWTDYGVQDNSDCTALVIDKETIAPDAGKHSWIRVKTWNWDESVPSLVRYSDPKLVSVYESTEATAADDKITILSAIAGKNGTSIKVQLGWTNDGNTGTELSWSDEEDTWKSTEQPEDFTFTWTDGSHTSGGTTYYGSALVTIKGLEPSTKYWIHARRYLEGENSTTYSAAAIKTCVTSNTSLDADQIDETVVASCSGVVPKGESLQVYWAFSSNNIQKKWQIISTAGKVILEGEGSTATAQIPADRLEAAVSGGVVTFKVYATADSEPAESNALSVRIAEKPTLSVSASDTLAAQPIGFTATVSKPCSLMVIVSSQGAAGQFPVGMQRQTAGDTIYSGILQPEWEFYALTEDEEPVVGKTYYTRSGAGTEESPYVYTVVEEPSAGSMSTYYEDISPTAVITLPSGLDFWDLGRYTLSVTAIDKDTGLRSEPSETEVLVGWTNKAVVPFDNVTVTPVDATDDSGQRIRAADIVLTAPTGSQQTDVYDIYRLTGDGAVLIGEGFPLSFTARDLYAPFGDRMTQHYRIALRTADGDVNFSDIEYVADADYLKLDWDGHSIDLPYSVTVGDAYEKSVTIRQHMDGSVDGYWNRNILRKGKLHTDVIKLIQQNEIDLVRQLARYPGAVFVRTPDGCAYEADVQVSDLSTKNSAVLSIALDATEIGLTDEFILPTPFEEEEEES